VVKARLNRLKINSISVADATGAVEKLFKDAVYDANELDIELPAWLEKLAVYGDSYLLVWPAADANVNEDGTADAVDVFVHSPLTMRAIYSEENSRKIDFVIHAWQRSDGFLRADLYYPRAGDGIERWVSIKEFGDLRGRTAARSIAYEEGMFEELPADDGEDEDDDPAATSTTSTSGSRSSTLGLPARTAAPSTGRLRPAEHPEQDGGEPPLGHRLVRLAVAVRASRRTGTTGPDLNDWNKDNRQVPGARRRGVHRGTRSARGCGRAR
jgi:hypothetical protein